MSCPLPVTDVLYHAAACPHPDPLPQAGEGDRIRQHCPSSHLAARANGFSDSMVAVEANGGRKRAGQLSARARTAGVRLAVSDGQAA